MNQVRKIEIVIDLGRPLAPQVVVYRAIGIPWKLLAQLCGRPKNRLEEQVATWRRKQGMAAIAPSFDV